MCWCETTKRWNLVHVYMCTNTYMLYWAWQQTRAKKTWRWTKGETDRNRQNSLHARSLSEKKLDIKTHIAFEALRSETNLFSDSFCSFSFCWCSFEQNVQQKQVHLRNVNVSEGEWSCLLGNSKRRLQHNVVWALYTPLGDKMSPVGVFPWTVRRLKWMFVSQINLDTELTRPQRDKIMCVTLQRCSWYNQHGDSFSRPPRDDEMHWDVPWVWHHNFYVNPSIRNPPCQLVYFLFRIKRWRINAADQCYPS